MYINDLLGFPNYCLFESYVADESKLHISFSVKRKDIYGAVRQMTEDLKKVVSWYFQNTSLRINPDKTKLLNCHPSKAANYLTGKRVASGSLGKDLGVHMDGTLSFDEHKNFSSSCLSSL